MDYSKNLGKLPLFGYESFIQTPYFFLTLFLLIFHFILLEFLGNHICNEKFCLFLFNTYLISFLFLTVKAGTSRKVTPPLTQTQVPQGQESLCSGQCWLWHLEHCLARDRYQYLPRLVGKPPVFPTAVSYLQPVYTECTCPSSQYPTEVLQGLKHTCP